MPGSLPSAYFDDLYAKDGDPWRFETSDYEREKYDETIRSLGCTQYDRALEVGCSIGVLTQRLAPFCRELIATDVVEVALGRAAGRLSGSPNVSFVQGALPAELPDGPFDLIVLSEVLYYLDEADLARAAEACLNRLRHGGEILMVHWLGETPDYPLTGDEAAEAFLKAIAGRLTTTLALRRQHYRLERLRREM